MKTYSDERPLPLLPLGDGNWHYNHNIEETEAPAMEEGGEPRTQYVCDTVFIGGEPTVGKIVAAVVRETYTDEDVAMMSALHQAAAMGLGDEPDGYSDYLSLVVATRTEAAAAMNATTSRNEQEEEG